MKTGPDCVSTGTTFTLTRGINHTADLCNVVDKLWSIQSVFSGSVFVSFPHEWEVGLSLLFCLHRLGSSGRNAWRDFRLQSLWVLITWNYLVERDTASAFFFCFFFYLCGSKNHFYSLSEQKLCLFSSYIYLVLMLLALRQWDTIMCVCFKRP